MFKISYIYDLIDNISPQLKQIQANLETTKNKVASSAQSMASSFNGVSQSLNSTAGTLAPLSIGLGVIGTKAITSAANFETLGIQLEILTGSAEKGKNLFQELSKYAAATPFELPDIVQATRTLLGSNIALDNVVNTTKMLGDVAAGSGADIKSLAVVFGQVAGATKLQGQDAMQFVSNGIPIWSLLQKTTGKSIEQLRELGTKGELSFNLVSQALTQATQEGGMYYQATEKLSKSLGGLYSTLRDNVNIAFGELGAEMVKSVNLSELIVKIGDFAGKLTEKFKSLSPETKKFISYAVLVGAVLAPVALVLGSLIGVLGLTFSGLSLVAGGFIFLATPVGMITASIIALIGTIYLLKDSFVIVYDFLRDKFASVFDYIAEKIMKVIGLVNDFRANTATILDFVGLGSAANFVAPEINQSPQINRPQSLTAGGELNVNIRGLPKGSSAGFTPRPNNFLPVGINSVFAGS